VEGWLDREELGWGGGLGSGGWAAAGSGTHGHGQRRGASSFSGLISDRHRRGWGSMRGRWG
jgi:hypothetical protein